MTDAEVLAWLREHNAGARFESDGTVLLWVNGVRRRRPTLVGAIDAVCRDLLKTRR